MEFGEYIRLLRKERKLDIRSLADKSGVQASTISRVENSRTQVTLLTAVRLCEGLSVNVADVLEIIYEMHRRKDGQEQQPVTLAEPTINDVEQFLSYFHGNEEEGKAWLVDLLNKVISISGSILGSAQGDTFRLFVKEDIQKLLLESPIYRFEIQYPQAITSNDILNIYRRGGMLTLTDVGEYIKKLRHERQVTLEQMEQRVKLSPSILSRLESGFTEQIKLADVLTLDQHLSQGGTLVSMYWETYSNYERIIRRQAGAAEQNLKLTVLFILVCRWLQLMNPQEGSWMRSMRSCEKLA